jgi:hypothetical protein
VINGAAEASYLELDGSEENAIVRVDVTAPDGDDGDSGSAGAVCTGVLVAPGWILTARHCVPSSAPATAIVSFGEDLRNGVAGGLPCAAAPPAGATAPAIRVHGTRLVPHGEFDLMLVELEARWPIPGLTARPIPVGGDDALAVGALAQLGGFGRTESAGGVGLRRFLTEEIVALDDRSVTVDGHGRSGLCTADSGGPMLVRGTDGNVFTAGILSSGSSDCVGQDTFTRLAAFADWLDATIGPPAARPVESAPCGSLDGEGRCFGSTAVWCDQGSLRGDGCGDATACGWSRTAGGFRCVAAADDPCGGVPDTGTCLPTSTVRCDRGQLVETSCTDCIRRPESGVATCAHATSTSGP